MDKDILIDYFQCIMHQWDNDKNMHEADYFHGQLDLIDTMLTDLQSDQKKKEE